MVEVIYNLSKLLPYFIVFPIVSIILYIILIFFSKRRISGKHVAFSGIFMNLSNRDIMSMALLITYLINILTTIFFNELSTYNIVFIFIPIFIYSLLNINIKDVFINLISTVFLFLICYFEKMFVQYVLTVTPVWYIVLLVIVLFIFIVLFSFFVFMRNFYVIINKSRLDNKTSSKKDK